MLVLVAIASGARAQDADGGVVDAGVQAVAPSFFEENWHGTSLLARTPFLYEVGFVVGGGGLIHSPGVPTVPVTGVTVRERSGVLSALLVGLFGNVVQAFGAVRVDNVKQTREVSGNTVTTTTTADVTVLKSPEQLEKEQDEFRRGVSGITWMDLTVYADNFLGWNRGVTGGAGYEFAIGAQGELFQLGRMPVVLDVGFHLANVRVPPPPGSGVNDKYLYYASGGLLGRLIVPLGRFAAASVEWIFNFLSFDYLLKTEAELRAEGRVVSSPLKLSLELYATDRVMIRAQAILGGFGFTDGKLGGQLVAGVRL